MSLPPAVVLLILIFSVWQFYIVLNDIKSPATAARHLVNHIDDRIKNI